MLGVHTQCCTLHTIQCVILVYAVHGSVLQGRCCVWMLPDVRRVSRDVVFGPRIKVLLSTCSGGADSLILGPSETQIRTR